MLEISIWELFETVAKRKRMLERTNIEAKLRAVRGDLPDTAVLAHLLKEVDIEFATPSGSVVLPLIPPLFRTSLILTILIPPNI